ncbi:MAG: hypothetical protein IT334_09170 [Thermomicrobiales bacterium]|nr:hypothetical protein [Thermomicrobiales bacterium]
MAGADFRRYSIDRRGMSLNAPVAILSSALLAFADAFLLPAIVIAAVTSQLTDDLRTVGLAVSLAGGLWYLPQVLSTGVIQHRRRVKPVLLIGGGVRAAALGLFVWIGFRADDFTRSELLRWFLLALIISTVASAFSIPPMNALATRSVRSIERKQIFTRRPILALILAVGAGLIIARVFGPSGPDFPRNLTLLMLAAAASVAAGTFLAGLIREPARLQPHTTPALGEAVRGALHQLKLGPFRRFIFFRTLTGLSAGFDPLIILFGFSQLGVPFGYIGYYVALYAGARLLAEPLWALLARSAGHRALLQATTFLRLLALGVALVLPSVVERSLWQDNITTVNAPAMALGLSFALLGAASSGLVRGSYGYLNETVAQNNRFYASVLTNTILTVTAFAPILILGNIAERGYEELLAAGALLTLITLLASGLLTNSAATVRWRVAIGSTRVGRGSIR